MSLFKKRWLVIFLLALLGVGAAAAAQDFDKIPVQTVKITAGVSMLIGGGGNIGVCVGPDGVLLIDDQFPQLAEKIKAAIAALDPGPIRLVFNTNWHYDHSYGNEWLAKAGAIIIAQENSRKHMLSEWGAPELDAGFKVPPYPEIALPKITIKDSLTLYFNSEEIRAFHCPNAHSDGDLVLHFLQSNVIQTGDVFFSAGFPFINISSGGTIDGMIAAVDKILPLADASTKIIPGHGPLSDRAGLQSYRDMLAASRERIAKLIQEGRSLEEVLKANPAADLYKGKSDFPAQSFTKVVYLDLSKKKG
jgi:cyclase